MASSPEPTYTPRHLKSVEYVPQHGNGTQAAGSHCGRGMGRTFGKNILRTITHNWARFFAVFFIVAIGAGVYAGLRMFVPDMYSSADAFFDEYNLADIQIVSPLGLTNDDIEAVLDTEGVRGATGVDSYEMSMTSDSGLTYEVEVEAIDMAAYERAQGIADGREGDQSAISRLIVVEGRLPQSADEIVISTNGQLKDDTIAVGDVLTINEIIGVDDMDDVLAETSFTVVGLVQSPEWLSTSTGLSPTSGARITNYAYIDLSAMTDPTLFTGIYVTTTDGIDETSFTDAYDDSVAVVVSALKETAVGREEARYNDLLNEINDARDEVNDAIAQANDGRAEAEDAIDQAQAILDEYQPIVDELSQYDDDTLYWMGQTENLALARDAIDQANEAITTAQDGIAEAEDALAEANDALDLIEESAAELEPQSWYVLDRNSNESCYLYKATAMRMDRICSIFPIFFFLVAALVSLTTVSRMVETDRVEIGTLKALGYSKGAISLKYLVFSFVASLLGGALGIVIGVYTLPIAIWTPYSRMYIDFGFLQAFHEPDCALALVVSVVLTMLVTWLAVRRTLRESAATLLLPARPKSGRRIVLERIRPFWRHLSFSWKVTTRNIFRYKLRMVMTIVGVAGCTGLVLTAFGFQYRIDGFVDAQYYGIYGFDVVVNFDPDLEEDAGAGLTAEEGSELAELLDEEIGEGAWTYIDKQAAVAENPEGDPTKIAYGIGGKLDQTGGSTQASMRDGRSDITEDTEDGILRDVFVYVMQDGSDQEQINIDDYKTGERLILPDEGAIITERLAEQLLVGVGDTIDLAFDTDDDPVTVEVCGIMHNFVGHYVYMSPEAYEAAFGEAPTYNMVLGTHITDKSAEEVIATIAADSSAVISTSLPSDESGGYEDIAESLNSIVVILLIVSGMLAFIVIYALTEINIEERHREIATLKVLGFYRHEVRGYVYRETYILVGIGILIGLPYGWFLCDYIMRAAEFDNVIYFRTLGWTCYVFAIIFTALIAFIVTLLMRRRLNGINMVASLKSVD